MNTYDVIVYYSTPLSRRVRRFNGVVASTAAVARAIAEAMFLEERKKPGLVRARVTGVTHICTQPVVEPVQTGDVIEVKIKGRVRLRNDGRVELSDGRQKILLSREAVTRDTGRPVGPKVTVEYLAWYPTSAVYESHTGPIKSSSYGLDQLIQIKVTKHDGKIVDKEFV